MADVALARPEEGERRFDDDEDEDDQDQEDQDEEYEEADFLERSDDEDGDDEETADENDERIMKKIEKRDAVRRRLWKPEILLQHPEEKEMNAMRLVAAMEHLALTTGPNVAYNLLRNRLNDRAFLFCYSVRSFLERSNLGLANLTKGRDF